MTKKTPIFNYKTCMVCHICEKACPFGVIALDKTDQDRYRKAYPELAVPANCTGCGLCARACPIGSVEMRESA